MDEWRTIIVLIIGGLWLAIVLMLFLWGIVRSWLWARKPPPPAVTPPYETVHDGSGLVAGFFACLLWPCIIPLAIYEKIRYHK